MFKLISEIVFTLIFIALLVLVGIDFEKRMANAKFTGVKVDIRDSSRLGFITKTDILQKISQFQMVKGQTPLGSIKLHAIEKKMLEDIYIDRANVYVDMFGNLCINIEQFIPRIRVVAENGVSYFIDENYKVVRRRSHMVLEIPIITVEGESFPLASLESLHNKFVSGTIEPQELKILKRVDNLIEFCNFVDSDGFWNNMIVQVNMNTNRDIELIPRVGEHLVVVCNVDSLGNYDRYMNKLSKFYTSGTEIPIFAKYKKISLKYKDLVVCTKR